MLRILSLTASLKLFIVILCQLTQSVALAENIRTKGTVTSDVYVKKSNDPQGCENPSSAEKECTPGNACYAVITIQGKVAQQLYRLLSKHGLKDGLFDGDPKRAATTSGALECADGASGVECRFGYDVSKNLLTDRYFCVSE